MSVQQQLIPYTLSQLWTRSNSAHSTARKYGGVGSGYPVTGSSTCWRLVKPGGRQAKSHPRTPTHILELEPRPDQGFSCNFTSRPEHALPREFLGIRPWVCSWQL